MFIVSIPISIAKVSMNVIGHIARPAKITSRYHLFVKVAKNWFNRIKPWAVSRQGQNLESRPASFIPRFYPAVQGLSVMSFGIIPNKVDISHMFIQISQSFDKFQHYFAALALIYVVVYLAGVCLQRAKDNHFASGFPEGRHFPHPASSNPLLPGVRSDQIRPSLIQIKGYFSTFVHAPKRPLDTVFFTSYPGSGEVSQRLERIYEYPSSAITLRIYSGLIALTTLVFIAIWHNPLRLQLLQASPNTLGLVLSSLIICFLCFVSISLGRPLENFWYNPAVPL